MQESRPPPSRDRTSTAGRTAQPDRDEPGDAKPARPAEPPDSHAGPPDDPIPAPVRFPDDDFIAETDRQVLVVGDTVAGLTLTLLLERAGYDPVLVAGPETPAPSRLASLWPPARQVLDAAGVDADALGCAVDGIAVRPGPQADATVLTRGPDALAPPVLVRTTALRRRLAAHLPDTRGVQDRTVDSVSRRDGGLVVEFDDGVREWFDVAVDASGWGGPLRAGGDPSPGADGGTGAVTSLTQYEVPVEAGTARNGTSAAGLARVQEAWQRGALVQSLPRPAGAGHLLRVTTTSDAPGVSTGTVREALPETAARVPDLSGVEPAGVRQVASLPADPARAWWSRGRVAFCAGAACPFPPASGVRVSAGIEDALALVSQLARGPRAAVDAIDAYAARRARRVGRLARSAAAARTGHAYPVPDRTRPGLATLGLLRTVALGPLLGPPVAPLQREGVE
jgi:2-polyprenyl-6-methoxyphenol hydroxylase-like FAD-dependent oxidoreductase